MSSILSTTLNTRFVVKNGINTNTIRSDKLDNCTDEDITRLKELGIEAVIDLRAVKINKCPYIEKHNIQYYNVPFENGNWYEYFKEIGIKDDLDSMRLGKADYYVHLLEVRRPQILKILEIWHRHNGHVLIHCSIGRDRTGIICFILQEIMGCSNVEIINEYAASAKNLESVELKADKYVDYNMAIKIGSRFLQLCNKDNLLSEFTDYVLELDKRNA